MSSGKAIGGEDWVGKKVETWWGTTSKWEPGEIVEYKAIRDEYKVRYEDDEEHWEQVDSLFRFKDETAEKQKQELLKLQEGDISGVKEKITKDSNLETWVKGFVRKIYVFLDGDTDQVLEFLDPDMKVIDQMPQLIRTQPFPLTQKLSTLRAIVRDDILFAKITKILMDEKAFPLVGRRKGHGRPRGRGRPKGSANRRIAQRRLAEHLDDIDVANDVSNFALCPPSPTRVKIGPNAQLPPEMAQTATSSTTRSITSATKITDKVEETSHKLKEKEKEKEKEEEDDDEDEILPPRKRIKLANSESRARKHEKEKEKEKENEKTSKSDHVPDSPEGTSGAGDNNAEDVTLDPSFMESIESLSFVRELARASGRRTHGKNATRWAPHFVKQQQKLFDAYQQGTIGTPQRTLRSRPPTEVTTKEPKKRGRKKKEVTASEKGEGPKEKINSNSEKQDKQEKQEKPEEKKEETKKEEPVVKRKRGRPRKIRPKEEEERIKAEEAKKKEREAESKKTDGEKVTAEPDKKEKNGKERDEDGKREIKATITTETNKRDTSNLEKTDERKEEKGKSTNELSADGNSSDESADGKGSSLPLSHRRRKMEAQTLAAQNSTTASSKSASASSEIKIEVDIESILNGPDENPTDLKEVSIRKSSDRVSVAKKEEVFESELRSKLRNSGGKPLRSSLKKGQDEEFSEKHFRQRQDNEEHEQHKPQFRSNEPAHFRPSEPLFRANESQRQHRPAVPHDKEEKPDTIMDTHDASEKSETHSGNFGANGSHKRKRKHMHLEFGGDPETDLDAQAE